MKHVTAISALVLAAACAAPLATDPQPMRNAVVHPLIGSTIGLDHISLWAKNNAAAEAELEQLGFTLTQRPGYYGAGISNKQIWFENRSFLEFLWLSDPALAQREAPDEYAFASSQSGVQEYTVQVENAQPAYDALAAAGLQPEVHGSDLWDPDGPEGPKKPMPSLWKNINLGKALPGDPSFIDYNLPATATYPRRPHANGAKRISSVWVAVRDVAAAERAYAKAGFTRTRRVSLPHLSAEGIALGAGTGEILLISAVRDGPLRRRLLARGDHVAGMSVEVADLAVTERLLEQRMQRSLARERGPFGVSLAVQPSDQLGIGIAFHD